ncbi:MAG TPA: hypothetical protein VHO70_23120 [Chitinispirillaceae bacterium]|nr:hypothetical protein [Chitinispirillaceae bacterium]
MGYTKIFIALITVISFSFAQQDTSSSKKYNSTSQKDVVESPKTLNKALLTQKPKTTWTKIKDLFM